MAKLECLHQDRSQMGTQAEAFLTSCVDRIVNLPEEHAVMILGVKDDLKKLQAKVELIKAVLEDAERKKLQYRTIEIWLNSLKDVLYEADDIIDLCRTKGRELLEEQASSSILQRNMHCSLLSFLSTVRLRHNIGSKIRKLSDRFTDIENNHLVLSLCHLKPCEQQDTTVNEIISQARGDYGQAKTKAELQPIMANTVANKCLFLVLDDIWSADVWNALLCTPLHSTPRCGCVLVTTRHQDVARGIKAMYIHEVQKLHTRSSLELLCKKARVSREDDIERLVKIGEEIVRKCDCLPLAIKLIGSLLARKGHNPQQWSDVLRSGIWNMKELPGELKGAWGALYMSYEDLPPHLKQCFLSLSLFPADYDLAIWDLRALVLVLNGKVIENLPSSIENLLNLRMLNLNYTSIASLPMSVGSLKNLQILYLIRRLRLHSLPASITQLDDLRCLGLNGTPVTHVPKGLGKLKLLNDIDGFVAGGHTTCQTELQEGWGLEELESLAQLRWLSITRLERAMISKPMLKSKCFLRHLILSCTMPQYEKLSFEEIITIEAIFEGLFPPPSLEKLQIINFCGQSLPGWLISSSMETNLPCIEYIHLIGCSFCTQLPPFGKLPQLRYLNIEDAFAIVNIGTEFVGMHGVSTAFPKLEYLTFNGMPNWEERSMSGNEEEDEPSMPHLVELYILGCPKLRSLPSTLQKITTIQTIGITKCDSLTCVTNFRYLHNQLVIEKSSGVEIISNLLALNKLVITDVHALKHIEHLPSLRYMELCSSSLDKLPEWLQGLADTNRNLANDLQLTLRCSITLMRR
uniref:NB-ARC domain-containing protein n=1 Tax=Oryza meridionalis TaxID=40149 RepID=A0A0E0EQ97_9ORYZ